jgi:cathepsin L
MSVRRALWLVPVLLVALTSTSDAQVSFANREKVAASVIKERLERMRAEIKQKKRKFKVGYTSAMDFKLAELARTKPPPDLPTVASEQNAKASGALLKFKNLIPKAQKVCDPKMAAFDWKRAGKMTPVKNQGGCGSCWSFTGSAAFEGSYNIVNGRSLDVSEQQVVDCAKNKNGSDAGSCGGGWYAGVFEHFIALGAVSESEVPYKGKDLSCDAGKKGEFHAATWGYVMKDGSIPPLADMKSALCSYGPVATTVFVTDAFMAYADGVFDENPPLGPKEVNHGITLVGWDDSKGAYLIKNSWGTGWGEDGYMWIQYGSNNVGYGAAWVLASTE